MSYADMISVHAAYIMVQFMPYNGVLSYSDKRLYQRLKHCCYLHGGLTLFDKDGMDTESKIVSNSCKD